LDLHVSFQFYLRRERDIASSASPSLPCVFGFAASWISCPFPLPLAFRQTIAEINLQRHHSHSLLLNGGIQLVDLRRCRSSLRFLKGRGFADLRRYSGIWQFISQASRCESRRRLRGSPFAFAQGLDLCTHQYQTCLELVEQLVVVRGSAVLSTILLFSRSAFFAAALMGTLS